jgi:hypothetical protein
MSNPEPDLNRYQAALPTNAHKSPRRLALGYALVLGQLALLGLALGWVAIHLLRAPATAPSPNHEATSSAPPERKPNQPTVPQSDAAPAWTFQNHAEWVDMAQSRLLEARRERAEAERLTDQAAMELQIAQLENARLITHSRTFSASLRDASPRIARAGAVVAERQKQRAALEAEILALERAPKPRPKPLIDKSPVARPPRGSEFHFELRGGRVSFINMEELLDRLKVDARIQIRMMSIPRPVSGEAGPVGEFSVRYKLVPVGMALSGRYGSASAEAEYTLSSYEIVPMRSKRGETLRAALEPASDFGRALNQLDPLRDTITLWVYPDTFELFRALRDLLHQKGFRVAARPLPDDMPIRGSPTGSISAAQ